MKQKHVLITGASRGIGRACALAFSRAGFHVFLNCRNSVAALEELSQELTAIGASCTVVPGDVGNPDAVREIFSTIESLCPGLDVLVNNAGISHIGLLQDMTDSQWSDILNTNLSSVFYCCRAAIPPMIRAKRGKIINISSMWGTSGASCEVAYSAAKAGIAVAAITKAVTSANMHPLFFTIHILSFHIFITQQSHLSISSVSWFRSIVN